MTDCPITDAEHDPGQPFIGTCSLCGKTGLPASAALETCENIRGLTVEQSVIEAITGEPEEYDPAAELPNAETLEQAINQRNAWCRTAALHLKNEEYYRGLVSRIGVLFGDAAKRANDGTIMEDVLCAKVPELVTQLEAIAQFLFARLDDIDTASDMAKADDKAYRTMVERLPRRRFEVAMTDGYTVRFIFKEQP